MKRVPDDLFAALVAWRQSLISRACVSQERQGKPFDSSALGGPDPEWRKRLQRADQVEAGSCARVAATLAHWTPEAE